MTPTLSDLQHALPEDLARKLNELAAERGLSPADVVLRHFQEQAREGVEVEASHTPQSLDELKPRVPPPPGMTIHDMLTQEPWPGEETDEEFLAALKEMGNPAANLSPEELTAALKAWRTPQSLEELRPRRPPPPGMTAMQFIEGKWPGDETEEELLASLKAMG